MIWGAIAAAAASAIGQAMAEGRYADAQRMREIALQNIVQAGMNIPAFDKLVAEQAQGYGNIQANPQARQAQMDALSQLQSLSSQGGMDPQAQAQMVDARNSANQYLRSNTQAVLNDRQARGLGGSGDELAAILSGGQAASQQNMMGSVSAAAAARERALQALMGGSQLAGNIRGQDFELDNSNRNAFNAMQEFNTGLRQQANMYNKDYQLALAQAKMQSARDYANATNGVAAGADASGDRIGRDMAAAGEFANNAMNAYGQSQQSGGGDLQMPSSAGDSQISAMQNQGTIGGFAGQIGGNDLTYNQNGNYRGW